MKADKKPTVSGPPPIVTRPGVVYLRTHKERQTFKGKLWGGKHGTATGNRQQERNLRRMGVVTSRPEDEPEPQGEPFNAAREADAIKGDAS
jgi:hypothetical protein